MAAAGRKYCYGGAYDAPTLVPWHRIDGRYDKDHEDMFLPGVTGSMARKSMLSLQRVEMHRANVVANGCHFVSLKGIRGCDGHP